MNDKKMYLCIDLKSFYASVECIERGLDPFNANLVVADPSRGNGAITLAATPAIKKLGVKSRGRIYEIPENIDYIIAKPRMSLYMRYSADIYGIFLKFISSEDIHVYSIDESFLDVTPYLSMYDMTAEELAKMKLDSVYKETGITATVGIGTNLYLAKIALDITAKHSADNMVESNVLSLTEKHLVTNHISLSIGYSKDIIKSSRASRKITNTTNSFKILLEKFTYLYNEIVNPCYPIRQIFISFDNVRDEAYEQLNLFVDGEEAQKEKKLQETLVAIRSKYGKMQF